MTGKYSLNPEPHKCYSGCTTPNVNDTLNPYDSNTDLCLSVEVARLFGKDKLTFTFLEPKQLIFRHLVVTTQPKRKNI